LAKSCTDCKRKKAAAAAPSASCRQCRHSPCDCTAASSKRPHTAAPEATAQVRCASCSAWSNCCDDCRRQPPADPVPLAYCQTCKNTPCCKSASCCHCWQLKRMRSAPAPSGHVSIHSVEAGSTCQALFANERLPGSWTRPRRSWHQVWSNTCIRFEAIDWTNMHAHTRYCACYIH
jgi:hypothetical protein